jgi:PAS domain S-box-containing protein
VAELRRGRIVTLARLDALPPAAVPDREGLLAAGVRSIVLVPLTAGDESLGVLSLETVGSERAWPEGLVGRLPLLREIFVEVLARRHAESVLRESEQRFRLLAEAAPVMIWMSGPDALCTYFNRRWLDFTGRRLEQELGDGWTKGVHPDDLDGCLDGYWRAFAAQEEFTLEYRLRGADGRYRWVLDHGTPRTEANGRFRGYIGSCVDTTDLKAAQQALLESTRLQRAVFASLQGRLAALDRDGVIVAVNEMWTRFARDHAMDLAIGVNYLDVCRKEAAAGSVQAPAVLDAVESVLGKRSPRATLEYPWAGRDGECWFEMRVEPLQRAEGGAIVLHVDVTRRRRAEDDARRQRDELAHVLRTATMGELAGALAHEINQPLAAILTNAQAARRTLAGPSRDPVEMQEILTDIGADAKRAAEIIGRLRALVRKQEATSEPVDLNGLITDMARVLRHDLDRRGIAITFSLQAALPPVDGDCVQLQQVALNLLVNASDAVTAAGGGRREIAITTAQPDPDTVELSVSDTGIGVPETDLERIFAPFVSTKREGLGMGLAISRTIVAAHGGRIRATRNPERGITIHVRLPLAGRGGQA